MTKDFDKIWEECELNKKQMDEIDVPVNLNFKYRYTKSPDYHLWTMWVLAILMVMVALIK